jgi:hypothetical protein
MQQAKASNKRSLKVNMQPPGILHLFSGQAMGFLATHVGQFLLTETTSTQVQQHNSR